MVSADISERGLADTATKAGDTGGRLTSVKINVGDEKSVTSGVAEAVGALGGLDTLVNVAGILRSKHFLDTSLAEFEEVLRVNLIGTFLVTRAALPALREGTAPAVVNFSSTSAAFAHPYMSAYAASKGGVQAMTHALAAEFAKDGVRFNSVQPGSISSGMTDGTGESKQSVGPGLPRTLTTGCSPGWPRCCRCPRARSSPSPTRSPRWSPCSAARTRSSSLAPRSGSTAGRAYVTAAGMACFRPCRLTDCSPTRTPRI